MEVPDLGSDKMYDLRVQRRQVPITIKSASTLHTLQGATTEPGLRFHWRFPRFFSEELRWLATYVALSRPPSFKQLASMTPLQLICRFPTCHAAPIAIKQHKALAEVVDSILNRGADPNSVAAKNTVAGSVAGTYL